MVIYVKAAQQRGAQIKHLDQLYFYSTNLKTASTLQFYIRFTAKLFIKTHKTTATKNKKVKTV